MKRPELVRIARLVVMLPFIAILTGCYSSSKLIKVPEVSESLTKSIENSSKGKLPAFVSSINAKRDNGSTNASTDFERRFFGHLNQTNYFSEVVNGTTSKKPEPPYVDVSLDVDEQVDTHSGNNAVKGFFTGATFFLLAPALPAAYDYDTSFALHARWPNGVNKVYKASCAASASGTFPYVDAVKEFNVAIGNCTEKCLNSVLNQLTADRTQSR